MDCMATFYNNNKKFWHITLTHTHTHTQTDENVPIYKIGH